MRSTWAALLLVVVGFVLGYRVALAKGRRDLGIGLLDGIAAALVTGFSALIAFTAAVLSNFIGPKPRACYATPAPTRAAAGDVARRGLRRRRAQHPHGRGRHV